MKKKENNPENVLIQELPTMKLGITKSTVDYVTEHYNLEVKGYNLNECREGIVDLLYLIDQKKQIKKSK